MALKGGDRVRVDGREATITLIYAAGKHKRYQLDDGRELTDLDGLLASGSDRIKVTTPAEAAPLQLNLRLPEDQEVEDEEAEEESTDSDSRY